MKWLSLLTLLAAVVPGLALSQTGGEESAAEPPRPCSDPAARQFDFWIGEWDLTWAEGGTGTNLVTAEYGGCVVQEKFSAPAMGFQGMSVSVYDPATEGWRQTWVDDAGGYMDFTGGFEDGTMRLSRSATIQGTPVEQRMTFHNIAENSLDWDWEVSRDGGETWEMRWQIHYERKR